MDKFFYTSEISQLEHELGTSITKGLVNNEVIERQKKYGMNQIEERKGKNLLQKFIEQIGDFMILTLLGAAIISFVLGEKNEAILIVAIVIINAALGILQESRAERSLEAIKKLSSPHALVLRNGEWQEIKAEEVVVGDIIYIKAGDYIPADARLFEVNNLRVDESALTGESVAVEKTVEKLPEALSSLGDLTNLVFMGTAVSYGSGKALVIHTGMETEIGKIAKLINEVEYIQTPIQKSLEHLGKILLLIVLFICAIIFFMNVRHQVGYFESFITVVSLAVAVIPEGLPAIVTIVLAIGMQRMVKQNALIRKLPAVETLGSTTVICSDKTGTLTQNKMQVTHVYTNQKHYKFQEFNTTSDLQQIALWGVLCNNTRITSDYEHYHKIGDSTEIALIDFALELELDPIKIRDTYTRIEEVPFDSERKMMSTIHQINQKRVVVSKGAPEVILKKCKKIIINQQVIPLKPEHTKQILAANDQMTKSALRVIAVAYRVLGNDSNLTHVEQELVFVGLIGMIDPPRPEVYQAINICHQAGIHTVMITGDHKNTAVAIAKTLNILKNEDEAITGEVLDQLSDEDLSKVIEHYRVFARVTPAHKVRIVQAWQEQGAIVAMTGDGVNDAPALKNADIGIAMGIAGTEVAKSAADMVLVDDNFSTIVKAVEEGRTIFRNIQKAIRFLLSCNMGEVMIILLGSLFGQMLFGMTVSPLTAVQLLWANLTTDSLIAIAIGLEKAEPDVMEQKANQSRLLSFESFVMIFFYGILIGFLAFMAFYIGYQMGHDDTSSPLIAQTMAFMTLTTCELFHAFNIRSEKYSLFKLGIFSNKYIIYAFLISILLQYGILCTPFTRTLFNITLLSFKQLLIILGLSIVPIIVIEIGKLFAGESNKAKAKTKQRNNLSKKQVYRHQKRVRT